MTSALAALTNATVTFQVAGTGVVTDPDTGNVVPVQDTLEVALYLKVAEVRSTSYPGVDTGATVYEGYAVKPSTLDAAIVKGSVGSLVFDGQPAVVCELLGVREPYGSAGLLGSVLAAALGERVRLVTREQI
jgi:hypothetical protein